MEIINKYQVENNFKSLIPHQQLFYFQGKFLKFR